MLNKLFLVKHEYSLENKQHDFEYDLKQINSFKFIIEIKSNYRRFYEQETVHHN